MTRTPERRLAGGRRRKTGKKGRKKNGKKAVRLRGALGRWRTDGQRTSRRSAALASHECLQTD